MHRRQFGAGLLSLASYFALPSTSIAAPVSWDLRPIEKRDVNWRLIARSDLIVRGRILVPPHALKGAKPDYVRLPIVATSILAGNETRKNFEFSYYPYVHPTVASVRSPSPAEVTSSVLTESIFYLQWVDRLGEEGAYVFADYTAEALVPASEELDSRVRTEAEKQKTLATKVTTLLAVHMPPLDERVAALATDASRGNTQAALDGLLALDDIAIAAIAKRLGDRRRLPDGAIKISLKGVKGAFEGSALYRIADVGSLMMFALHHGTKDGFFGWPLEETSERRRLRIVAAWRVWLGYSLGLEPA
jgi:hypothetical protein